MNEELEQVRSWLRAADAALTRRTHPARTAAEREGDFEEAAAAHRMASSFLEGLQDKRQLDAALITAIAPLHAETADLGILLSEIRFDERDRTEPMPRVWAG